MNAKEKHLASKMLELASEEFSNHGCNDVEDSFYLGWTIKKDKTLLRVFISGMEIQRNMMKNI